MKSSLPAYKWFAKSFWAAGFRKGDVVINTFTYHMSPAGILFHEGIRDCGATVVVAGTGNTDLQIQIMKDLKVTGFRGHAQLSEYRYQAGRGDGL